MFENDYDVLIMMDKGCEDLLPKKNHSTDTGWDVRAAKNGFVRYLGYEKIPTGIHLSMPASLAAEVRPRSGLSAKGVYSSVGTIDNGYTGEICIVIFCLNPMGFEYKRGDRISQLVFERVMDVGLNVVETIEPTHRGANGFGSSGVK